MCDWSKERYQYGEDSYRSYGEPGCVIHWLGRKVVGEGEQKIKKVVDAGRIHAELRFLKLFKPISDCCLTTDDLGNNITKVTWGLVGTTKFPMRIMSLF